MNDLKYCENCGRIVEPEEYGWKEYDHDVHAYQYFYEDRCPECGSADLSDDVGECIMCGAACVPGEELCEYCMADFRQAVNKIVAEWKGADRDDKIAILTAVIAAAEAEREELA